MKMKVFLGLGFVMLCVACLFWGEKEAPSEEPLLTAIEPRSASEDEPYINVGFYGSLTGEASVLGQMGQLGCRLAVDQINNEGGIHGKKIRPTLRAGRIRGISLRASHAAAGRRSS